MGFDTGKQKKTSDLEAARRSLLRFAGELKSASVAQVENDGDIIPEGVITGKFGIERSMDSKRLHFQVYTHYNALIATSPSYSSISAVMDGIQSVIKNAKIAKVEDQTIPGREILPFPKWVIHLDHGDRYGFILYSEKGKSLIHLHGYCDTKSLCKRGIDTIIRICKNPMIEKTYLHHHDEGHT